MRWLIKRTSVRICGLCSGSLFYTADYMVLTYCAPPGDAARGAQAEKAALPETAGRQTPSCVILPCKGIRQYLLTSQVSIYCHSPLQSSIGQQALGGSPETAGAVPPGARLRSVRSSNSSFGDKRRREVHHPLNAREPESVHLQIPYQ